MALIPPDKVRPTSLCARVGRGLSGYSTGFFARDRLERGWARLVGLMTRDRADRRPSAPRVNTRQLRAAGLSGNAITHRVEPGASAAAVARHLPGRPRSTRAPVPSHGRRSVCRARRGSEPRLGRLAVGLHAPKPGFPVDVTRTGGSRRGREPVQVHRTTILDPRRRPAARASRSPPRPARCSTCAETVRPRSAREDVAEAQVIGSSTSVDSTPSSPAIRPATALRGSRRSSTSPDADQARVRAAHVRAASEASRPAAARDERDDRPATGRLPLPRKNG